MLSQKFLLSLGFQKPFGMIFIMSHQNVKEHFPEAAEVSHSPRNYESKVECILLFYHFFTIFRQACPFSLFRVVPPVNGITGEQLLFFKIVENIVNCPVARWQWERKKFAHYSKYLSLKGLNEKMCGGNQAQRLPEKH